MKSIYLFIFVSFVCGQSENGGGGEKIGPCEEGEYLDKNGECQVCITGHYCPDGEHMFECPDGTFSRYGAMKCKECGCVNITSCRKFETYKIPYDYMSDIVTYAGSCEGPCKPRFARDSFEDGCIPCPQGTYCPGGYVGTLLCPRNHEPNEEQTGCKKCSPRMVSMGSNCNTCYKGTIYNEEKEDCDYCPEDMEQDKNDD